MSFNNQVVKHFAKFYQYIVEQVKAHGFDTGAALRFTLAGDVLKDGGFEFVVLVGPKDNELVMASGMVFESEEGVQAAAQAFNYWLEANNLTKGGARNLKDSKELTEKEEEAALKKVLHFPTNKTVH
jgi:hypothetical protein